MNIPCSVDTSAGSVPPRVFTPAPRGSVELGAKRLLDLAGSAIGLLLLSPVFLVIAALIKFHDGGPVFHRRRVIAPIGEFDAFKFRSMRVDADRILQSDQDLRRSFEQSFKLRSDPRVTAVGAVLRKFSLDELPQLFNVFCGQMSLVGPRMITAPELEKFGSYRELWQIAKPGLTGYWQIKGRQKTSYEERVRMDVYYIENWSLWLDLRVLLATPWKVLNGEGAY